MKILRSAGLVLALGLLTACASTGGGIIPADALSIAKRGLAAAHDAHEAAAIAASVAAKSGACVGSCATKAKDLLDRSESYLNLADEAVAVNAAPTVEQEVAEAANLISQIQVMTGAH